MLASEARRIVANAGDDSVELLLIEGAGHDSVKAFLESGGQLLEFLQQYGLPGAHAMNCSEKSGL